MLQRTERWSYVRKFPFLARSVVVQNRQTIIIILQLSEFYSSVFQRHKTMLKSCISWVGLLKEFSFQEVQAHQYIVPNNPSQPKKENCAFWPHFLQLKSGTRSIECKDPQYIIHTLILLEGWWGPINIVSNNPSQPKREIYIFGGFYFVTRLTVIKPNTKYLILTWEEGLYTFLFFLSVTG